MSILSVNYPDISLYERKFSLQALSVAKELWMHNHYLTQKTYSESQIQHINIFAEITRQDNCELTEFINKKLNSFIEEECHNKPLHKKIERCKEKYNLDCEDGEIINKCCELSSIGEVKW